MNTNSSGISSISDSSLTLTEENELLMQAAYDGNITNLEEALRIGANIQTRINDLTALHITAQRGYASCMKVLLEYYAGNRLSFFH